MRRRCLAVVISLLALLVGTASPAGALTIFYEVEEVSGPEEEPPGEEPSEALWKYTYTVSGVFSAGQGFSILFRPEEAEFVSALPSHADWDAIAIQPDPLLPDYGAYDALALVDDPDLGGPFMAQFFWIGAGPPGAQDFVFYDVDFSPLETGVTVLVPEPGTGTLIGLGLFGIGSARARRAGRSEPS